MIDGLLLLDKPEGLSSTQASQRVRRLLRAEKAGHVGSLDPLATGMLPVCLGEATKLASEVLEGAKVYRFRIALGRATSTGDREGEVIATAAVPVSTDERVRAVLTSFVGDTMQVPPMYSALKRDGRPLYAIAREGGTVERQPRAIRIDALELLGHGADWLDCEVTCGKGTYVRVLAEDIAVALGTCGHVLQLRRERVAPFPAESMLGLPALEALIAAGEAPVLLGPEVTVGHLPEIVLSAMATVAITQGREVRVATSAPVGATVRLGAPGGQFVGLGRISAPGIVAPKRLVAQKVSE